MSNIHPLVWLAVGGFAGYAVNRATTQRIIAVRCQENELNAQTVATALLTGCRACDRLEPLLEPLSEGGTPSLNTILSTFRSPVRN
jgi:hypothetical protein